MDSLLHIAGLAFIPMMFYMVYLGAQDIVIALRDHYGPQWSHLTARASAPHPQQQPHRPQGDPRGVYQFTI